MARRTLACAGLRRQGFDAHSLHERGHMAPAHRDVFALELAAQHARAHEGVLQMQLVDAAHQRQLGLAGRPGQVVDRAPADAQQAGLACDRQGVVPLDSTALRSAIPLCDLVRGR